MNTILCHGVFDLLHLGHIRHLQEARSLGDRLVVSITADKHVNKGAGRPQFSTEQRREALLALECVDEVVISDSGTAVETILSLKPAVYVKGPDYLGVETQEMLREITAIKMIGGQFHTTTSQKWSSTTLLRNVRLSNDVLDYTESARKRGFLGKIEQAFEKADKLKILFVGETIIDEYRYCKPLARPSKEFILAVELDKTERFNGGIIAAAKHADWANASIMTGTDAIKKSRYIGVDFNRKLFEEYSSMNKSQIDKEQLADEVKLSDVCVLMDFGHGLIDEDIVYLFDGVEFLAVTAQSNAANWGFNLISKYNDAHPAYVCIDEQEARLDTGIQHCETAELLVHLPMARYRTITRGRHGAVSADYRNTHIRVPAFIESGYDTMGAGDAFLAVAAPLLATGLDLEIATFVGNVAGGLKTAIRGHSSYVGRNDLIQNVQWLLK